MEMPVDPPELTEYLEALSDPVTVHRVAANWLLDLDQYNEWMNEDDYLIEASGKFVHSNESIFLRPYFVIFKSINFGVCQ